MSVLKGEIIGLKSVTLEAGSMLLVEEVSLSLQSGSRMAIVGANGAGKSTLLRALAQLVDPAAGTIQVMKGAVIEYVPQFVPDELKGTTVIEALRDHISERRPSVEEWKAYQTLSEFGLSGDLYERELGELSGGEANRVLLARALVVEPDFVMLDEPTNHLDIEATVRFEKLLQEELKCPFCLVSHDRQLLDSCTTQTLFLRDKKFHFFGLPYTQASVALAEHDQAQLQKRQDEEKEIARLQAAANRMQNWVKMNSDLAPRYQRLKRRAQELRDNRTAITRGSGNRLALSDVEIKAKALLRIPEYTVHTPDGRPLIAIKQFSVSPGERIAVIGRNGVGKSTFLKALVAAYQDQQGECKFNPQAKIGYFDQELSDMCLDDTPVEYVARTVNGSNDRIHRALIAAGIPYQRHGDKLRKFSGGERARTCFVRLQLSEPNFLILDEPTNHIDLNGVEDLEDQVIGSGAAVLMVSHDRRFVEEVAQRFFVIREGRLVEVGNLDEYYAEVLSEERRS